MAQPVSSKYPGGQPEFETMVVLFWQSTDVSPSLTNGALSAPRGAAQTLTEHADWQLKLTPSLQFMSTR
jgi:hypothetical protein